MSIYIECLYICGAHGAPDLYNKFGQRVECAHRTDENAFLNTLPDKFYTQRNVIA